LGDQIKEDETGRASGTYGEMRNICRAFGGDNVKEKGYLEDRGIDGTIFNWILTHSLL